MTDRLPEALGEAFADLAQRAFGLEFPGARSAALDDGVAAACALTGLSPDKLLDRALAGDAGVLADLADALTVGETYFFRDPQHFRLVEERIASARRPLLLWSAGCASGAEPYTLAIVAREVLGAAAEERVRILGTDLSQAALSAARRGVYRPWALRGLDPERLSRWFRREGSLWRVVDEVRALVSFRRLNLLELDDPGWPVGVDVVFCRNVLVYFGEEAIATAARGLARAMRPDGVLVTGPSDPLLTRFGLALEPHAGFIAFRRPDRLTPRPTRRPTLPPPPAPVQPQRPARQQAPARPAPSPPPEPPPDPLQEARELADRGDSDGALRAVDRVIAAAPLTAEAYLLRALLRQARGEHASVLEDARRALLLDRTQIHAHLVMAPSAVVLGNLRLARRALRNARKALMDLPPDTPIPAARATAAELLSACLQMQRSLDGEANG